MSSEQALYLKDNYLKEAKAKVIKADKKFIVLDKTIFYPNSGGQPFDTGIMERVSDRTEFKVVYAGKFGEDISHEVDKEGLKAGDEVECRIDWGRRYVFMRYHTADHVLTRVIMNETGARITGNQISPEKSRIDFDLEKFDKDAFLKYADAANTIIAKNLPVIKYFMPKEEAIKNPDLFQLKDRLPPDVKELRIVQIGPDGCAFDTSACGGTHLNNTSEIGRIEVIGAENKGAARRRIYFVVK
jgi:misacylated tRNA(Ala) deacylase